MMTKTSKTVIGVIIGTVFIALLLGFMLLFGILFFDTPLPTVQRVYKHDFENYLTEKYGEDLTSTFDLKDYQKAKKLVDFDLFEGFYTIETTESACYRSPDRTFHVAYDREMKQFVDDYQYEDIEQYSIDYFSNLFETDVAGVIYDNSLDPPSGSIDPFSIKPLLETNNTLWTEDNFEDMLKIQLTDETEFNKTLYFVGIYLKADFSQSISLYDYYLLKEEWQAKLDEQFPWGNGNVKLNLVLVNFDPIFERWSDYSGSDYLDRYGYGITYYWLCPERYGYTPYFGYYADTDTLYPSSYAEKYHDDDPKEYELDYGGEALVDINDYDIFNPVKNRDNSEEQNENTTNVEVA